MNFKPLFFSFFFGLVFSVHAFAANEAISRAVWVNEAIVATYTYNFKNFLARQKEIARYFTADGWIKYSKALNESKLPEMVKKNSYFVSAVATLPPDIKSLDSNLWEAVMPILVVYENPQYKQKQTLQVTIRFKPAPRSQGVRGLAITGLQSKVIKPSCKCPPHSAEEKEETADETSTSS